MYKRQVWTFTWFGPEEETQAANALIETGVDVLAQHQDSPSTGVVAEANGAKWISYNTVYGQEAAPEAFVGAPVWDWGPYYVDVVNSIINDEFAGGAYWGGMETGLVSWYEEQGTVDGAISGDIRSKVLAMIAGEFDPPIIEDEFIDNVIGTVSP